MDFSQVKWLKFSTPKFSVFVLSFYCYIRVYIETIDAIFLNESIIILFMNLGFNKVLRKMYCMHIVNRTLIKIELK